MANVIISNSGSLVINGGSSSMPKGGYTVTTDGSLVYVKAVGSSTGWKLDPAETTLDGASFSTPQDLVTALSDFSRGGTGPGSGVQGVTGDGVDNTDPENPVISYPTPVDIGAAATSHTHNASDINAGTLAAARIPSLAISKTTGLQAALDAKVGSEQESGVGTPISNIIQVTQAEYDGLTPQAGTFYAIVG